MDKNEVKICNAQEISGLLDDRGITIEDAQIAIAVGETTGKKLYRADDENLFLVRVVVGKFNIYAEYSPTGESFTLHTAYAHRLMFPLDEKKQEVRGHNTIWNCYCCQVTVEEVENIGLSYNEIELPDTNGYRCPKCKIELLSENLVMTELFMAERMLEAK